MTGVGEALEVARRAKGITQQELAATADLTQAALSRYEHDLRDPSDEVLARLAAALGVQPTLLRRAGRITGAMAADAHMRRAATANVGTWRRLEARLSMHRLHAHRLLEEVQMRTERAFPVLDPHEVDPPAAARITRMQWRMPVGPVRSLTAWLEAAGCLVVQEDFGTARVDGLSQWIDETPVILVNERAPTDRKRLTLAHELGHLVLHSNEFTDAPEEEANEFAAELLMPRDAIRPSLRSLSSGKLHDLKRMWMVSMQALIERAHQLGVLKATERTRLYKQLSARGWRRAEPLSGQLPPEVPALTFRIGDALADRGLSPTEIAAVAGYAAPSEDNPFRPTGRLLRAL